MEYYTNVVARQRAYFNTSVTVDTAFRIRQLKLLKTAIKENERRLYQGVYQDFRKSEFEVYTAELLLIYKELDLAIKKLVSWSKIQKVKTSWLNFPARCYTVAQPLGTCLIFGAWNYPFQLCLIPLISAIAAGCTVIIKPSEYAPASALAIQYIIEQCFDPEYVCVVIGGAQEGQLLLKQQFDKIFFTGSVAIGKIVYQCAAQHLTPVTLELSGKSPVFITHSAHIDMCVKRLVWAKFFNAGQSCVAPDFLLVDQQIKDEFLHALVQEIKRCEFSVAKGNYVQIINENHFIRLQRLLDGSTIYYQDNENREPRVFPPTVVVDVDFNDDIMQQEIFGPILPVLFYTDLKQAMHSVKAMPKALACYMFTQNKVDKMMLKQNLSFGSGAFNEAMMQLSEIHLPFGGVGQSGMGAYRGVHGFNTFSHRCSLLDKPTWFELPLKYSPYTKYKLTFIKKIIG